MLKSLHIYNGSSLCNSTVMIFYYLLQLSLFKDEFAVVRLNITSLEKVIEQLRRERDTALDESAIASVQVHKYE